jgi:hypothetical protein
MSPNVAPTRSPITTCILISRMPGFRILTSWRPDWFRTELSRQVAIALAGRWSGLRLDGSQSRGWKIRRSGVRGRRCRGASTSERALRREGASDITWAGDQPGWTFSRPCHVAAFAVGKNNTCPAIRDPDLQRGGLKIMRWGKLGALCSLKAILLACVLTPVSAPIVATTPAYAQFQIVIPGFGYRGYRRGYYRSHGSRRYGRRRGGGESQQSSGAGSAPGSASPVTSSRGYRSTAD